MKITTLGFATVISIWYCFRFGYIWTAYGHGGQLFGIPFAFVMVINTILFLASKDSPRRSKIYSFGIIYFLTLAGFSLTIETIRTLMKDYFQFLYSEPGGLVDRIFLLWIIIGSTALFILLRRNKKRRLIDKK